MLTCEYNSMATTPRPKRDCYFALYCTINDVLNSPVFEPTYQDLAAHFAGDEEALERSLTWNARAVFSLQIGGMAGEVYPYVRSGSVVEYDENGNKRRYLALILADRRYLPKHAARFPNWRELRVPPDEEVIAKIKAAMPVEALRTCQPRWFLIGSSVGGPSS